VKRQQFLLILLAVVAVTMLPVYLIDQTMGKLEQELADLQSQIALYREKANAVRELDLQVAQEEAELSTFDQRLIDAKDPFAAMHRAVSTAATKAGVQVDELRLVVEGEVTELPGLLRYKATVDLSGTISGFLEFLRLLEEDPLLIAIPDLQIALDSTLVMPRSTPPIPTPTPPVSTATTPVDPNAPAATTPPAQITAPTPPPPPFTTTINLSFFGRASSGN